MVGRAVGRRVGVAVALGVGVRDGVAEGIGVALPGPGEAVKGRDIVAGVKVAPGDAVGVGGMLAMRGAGGGRVGIGVGGRAQATMSGTRLPRSHPMVRRRFMPSPPNPLSHRVGEGA